MKLFLIPSFYTHDIFFQQNCQLLCLLSFWLQSWRCEVLFGFVFPWWVPILSIFLINNAKIAEHLSLENCQTDTPFIWFFIIFPIKTLIYFDIVPFSDVQFTNNFSHSEDDQLAASIVSLENVITSISPVFLFHLSSAFEILLCPFLLLEIMASLSLTD